MEERVRSVDQLNTYADYILFGRFKSFRLEFRRKKRNHVLYAVYELHPEGISYATSANQPQRLQTYQALKSIADHWQNGVLDHEGFTFEKLSPVEELYSISYRARKEE